MKKQVLVAGGGIGGLAAALGASRAGWDVRLYERAAAFSEVGAGVQIGPNVVRRLHDESADGEGIRSALELAGLAVMGLPATLRGSCGVVGFDCASAALFEQVQRLSGEACVLVLATCASALPPHSATPATANDLHRVERTMGRGSLECIIMIM